MDAVLRKYTTQLSNVQVAHYLLAGACALVIWDWLICLRQEYHFIWTSRRSAGKFLYLIHRYPLIIVSLVSVHFNTAPDIPITQCRIWVPIEHCLDILVVAFVQVTLFLRVCALYGKNKYLVLGLSTLFCASLTATFVFYSIVIRKLFYYPPVSPLVGCLLDCKDCFVWIPAIHMPLLLFDTLLVGLTLKKCIRFLTNERSLLPVLSIFFRDGIIYYIVAFVMMVFNIAFLYFSPASMANWFVPWMRTIVAIMGTRLLLNLRGHFDEERTEERRVTLQNSELSYTFQGTTPSLAHPRVAWPPRSRRVRGMSVYDHDPVIDVVVDVEVDSVTHVESDDVGLDIEMKKAKGSWSSS